MSDKTLTELLHGLLDEARLLRNRVLALEVRLCQPSGNPSLPGGHGASITGAQHQLFPVYDLQGRLIMELNPRKAV